MNKDKIKLKNFRLMKNMSRKKFAELLGLSVSLINMAETESKNPKNSREVSGNLKLKIQKVFKVDFDTEINQDGSIRLQDYRKIEKNFDNVIPIPFYSAKASAGYGETLPDYSEKDVIYFDARWLKNILGVNPNNISIIQARGDSMDSGNNPIKNGDLLLVDNSIKDIINEKVFVIQINKSELIVKKVVKEWDGTIKLISNNSKYEDRVLKEGEEAEIIGKVVWNGSKENV